jgi:NAD(P)-dependent dehydrogenase (short-subunit alcohol dehydrogenase family)
MKSIVITGSTRGIGYGLADAFLALGCQVTVSGRTQASVDGATAALAAHHVDAASRMAGFPCDVARFEQVQALWDAAVARFGSVDIWINNAGISNRVKDYWNLEPEEVCSVVETNIIGSMYGTTVALRGMLAQGRGALYNLEGLGSRDGRKVKGLSVYGTTKAALRYFTEAVALDTAGTPVIAGVILPGMVITDMITSQYVNRPEEWQRFKRILNIIADRVETVAPWIARRVLENTRNGARIQWITGPKMMGRFLTAPFHKRHVV